MTKKTQFFDGSLVLLGVVLPFLALAIEACTHMCASFYFDPIPSALFVVCVALVPISNVIYFKTVNLHSQNIAALRFAGILNAIALAVATVYTITFGPLLPICLIGIIFCGIGLLGLAPLGSFVVMVVARIKLNRLLRAQNAKPIAFDLVLSALLVVLALNSFSANMTVLSQTKANANPADLPKALLLMRAFGDQNVMLRSSYGLSNVNMPLYSNWIARFIVDRNSWVSNWISQDLARELCYRVTGKSFNAFPHPAVGPSDHYSFGDEEYYSYSYDNDFAGDEVGGVVRGLKMDWSRISGEVDPNAAVEHLVWRMKFTKTPGSYNPELRTQLMLPPGAVVSGCWLMVDGQRREASFQPRRVARATYENEAKSYHPTLLVATAGPGRVLLQAPSVTENLDLCVQIDAPIKILKDDLVETVLPSMTERNFEVSAKTDVVLNQIERNSDNVTILKTAVPANKKLSSYSNADLFQGLANTKLPRDKQKTTFTSESFEDPTIRVRQTFEHVRITDPKPLIVVLDGSDTMATCSKEICDSLEKIHFKDGTIVWASDKPVVLAQHVSTDSMEWKSALAKIRDSACVGGQDNAAAIKLSLPGNYDKEANIVWLHGPQAIQLGGLSIATIWRNPKNELYEYQAVLGPNALTKSLDSKLWARMVAHGEGITGDLELLFAQLSGEKEICSMHRQFGAQFKESPIDAPSFITALCANEQIAAHIDSSSATPADIEDYGELAAKFKIVTPNCSALVLLDPTRLIEPTTTSTTGTNSHPMTSSVIDKLNKLNGAETPVNSKTSSTAEPAKAPESASTFSSAADAKNTKNPTAIPTDPISSLIPTKPEPPIGMLMFCVLLMALVVRCKQRLLSFRFR